MNNVFFYIILFFFTSTAAADIKVIFPFREYKSAFAIVVDQTTYHRAELAIKAYKESIEEEGLSVYVLINNWKNPEEIKRELKKLYESTPPLEGAVFIGDIPIPMIGNAQHLTSAFKMDEDKYSRDKSTVPSDRFYDDFDLKFRFTGRDTTNTLCFYYKLTADSPQKIEREIYTARIIYSGNDDKYKAISEYLFKAVKQKKKKNIINNVMVFTGSGYYSGSLTAWGDKRISLIEQFPQLFTSGGRVRNLHHAMNDDVKGKLLNYLQDPELDIALFHAHGSTNAQMVIELPAARDAGQNADALKRFLRNKLRAAKKDSLSIEEVQIKLKNEYNVTDEWFYGAFDEQVITADSLIRYDLNIRINDIREISPQAKFIMFDQCYSGAFHLKEYMAGEYLFGKGNVIAAEANSVNVLQDKWADEFLGIINYGGRIGEWHITKNLLESHLLGDPTYRFTPADNFNEEINFASKEEIYWNKKLKSSNSVFRDLALYHLFSMYGKKFEADLLKIYQQDASVHVRMHALKYLASINGDLLKQVLRYSVNDPYEYIRRVSASLLGDIGDNKLLSLLVSQLYTDESVRVLYNARNALTLFNSYEAYNECINVTSLTGSASVKLTNIYKELIGNSENWLKDNLIKNILPGSQTIKNRVNDIRSFRSSRYHEAVPALLSLVRDKMEDMSVRATAAEALGWFYLSYQKNEIIAEFNRILKEKLPDIVEEEILKSKNRLEQGPNDPVLL
jgi:hypothetical protein